MCRNASIGVDVFSLSWKAFIVLHSGVQKKLLNVGLLVLESFRNSWTLVSQFDVTNV